MELLAPAGSASSIRAAALAGADAVYFGLDQFNARRNAKNLNRDEAKEAIRYLRSRNIKSHITVNTLVTDRELKEAEKLIRFIYEAGADAVIVQDLGMARMIRNVAPDLEMHASTQMTIHSLAGAEAAAELGFSRVVLARELPLTEIEHISKNAPIETEVFVHGALCMCYSGQCYLSAVIGQRSGNRGLCAQPCRLPYTFFADQPGYHLSLKDLTLAGHLHELQEAGVTSLKIEGRMKRDEYIAITTSIFSKALREGREPDKQEMEMLRQAFSRDGFTDGYFTGKTGPSMFGVKSEGNIKEIHKLYQSARTMYASEKETPRVRVDMKFAAVSRRKTALVCVDEDDHVFMASGPRPEKAEVRATTEQEIESRLCKTGGTIFYPGEVDVRIQDGLMIPASVVNALRRECLDGLYKQRMKNTVRTAGTFNPGTPKPNRKRPPRIALNFTRFDQYSPDMLECKPKYISFPLYEAYIYRYEIQKLIDQDVHCCVTVPRVIMDHEWKKVYGWLREMRKIGITSVLCGNIGQVKALSDMGFLVRGDFGLNVFNSQTMKEIKRMDVMSATASFEMTLSQIRDLSKCIDTEIIAYGRLPLMLTENCIIKCGTGKCICESVPGMTDRKRMTFPIIREFDHRTVLLNSQKLFLADKKEDYEQIGLSAIRLFFTTENTRECQDIVRKYTNGDKKPMPNTTRGLYYRGVE